MITAKTESGLESTIEVVSASLRESIEPIVREAAGAGVRPIALSRRLGIDKTLCGRILRAVKARDPFETIHEAPAPHGLRIFLSAAVKAGIQPKMCGRAEDSIEQFETLIGQFPEGRAALEAAISDYIPEVRQRNERMAKQAMYKSMAYVLGYQAEAGYSTIILTPNTDGRTVDSLHINGKQGLRRLRSGKPIKLFGIRVYEKDADDNNTWIETLDGKRGSEDARDFLIPEHCSNPLPELTVLREDDLMHTVLDGASLPLNSPVTLTAGWNNRRGLLRYRTTEREHEWHTGLTRIPTKWMVKDYFVHEDVYPGVMPEVKPRMQGLVADRTRRASHLQELDEVDLTVPLTRLGKGIDMADLRVPELPDYRSLLRQVFDRAGLNPRRFIAYRCRMVYPIPFVALTAWFRLPEQPRG